MHTRLTKSFQKLLGTVTPPPSGGSFAEQFAYKRFVKKFEKPDRKQSKARREATFETWLTYDQQLKRVHLPDGKWYRARLLIQKIMKHFQIGELTFTTGSSSEPLFGRQSIA